MGRAQEIVSIQAREIFGAKGYPGVEVEVITRNGARGAATAVAGTSMGSLEAKFAYDPRTRLGGWGVKTAADNVNKILAPALIGLDSSHQARVDAVIIELDGTADKSKLGANATGSLSAAVLKAGAASLGIPLYQHIGGVNACTLPVPGIMTGRGSYRYGAGEEAGGKPTYAIMCYGFSSFREAAYAGWEIFAEYARILNRRFKLGFTMEHYSRQLLDTRIVEHDRELWDAMMEAAVNCGYEGKVCLQADIAAETYYDPEKKKFIGLFSEGEKSKEDLFRIYEEMIENYSFRIIEDPFPENDFESHARLTKKYDIDIVGDDLFVTNTERLRRGIETGAANSVLLKVYQKGTITEALEAVRFAYENGYRVMPCSSRGEGADIADYAVGINSGYLREGAIDATGNRLIAIESELGSRAVFAGEKGLRRIRLDSRK